MEWCAGVDGRVDGRSFGGLEIGGMGVRMGMGRGGKM